MAKSVNGTRNKQQKLNISRTLLQLNELNLQLERSILANHNLADKVDLLDESLKSRKMIYFLNEVDASNKHVASVVAGMREAGKIAQAEVAVLKKMASTFSKIGTSPEFEKSVIKPIDSYVEAASEVVTVLQSRGKIAKLADKAGNFIGVPVTSGSRMLRIINVFALRLQVIVSAIITAIQEIAKTRLDASRAADFKGKQIGIALGLDMGVELSGQKIYDQIFKFAEKAAQGALGKINPWAIIGISQALWTAKWVQVAISPSSGMAAAHIKSAGVSLILGAITGGFVIAFNKFSLRADPEAMSRDPKEAIPDISAEKIEIKDILSSTIKTALRLDIADFEKLSNEMNLSDKQFSQLALKAGNTLTRSDKEIAETGKLSFIDNVDMDSAEARDYLSHIDLKSTSDQQTSALVQIILQILEIFGVKTKGAQTQISKAFSSAVKAKGDTAPLDGTVDGLGKGMKIEDTDAFMRVVADAVSKSPATGKISSKSIPSKIVARKYLDPFQAQFDQMIEDDAFKSLLESRKRRSAWLHEVASLSQILKEAESEDDSEDSDQPTSFHETIQQFMLSSDKDLTIPKNKIAAALIAYVGSFKKDHPMYEKLNTALDIDGDGKYEASELADSFIRAGNYIKIDLKKEGEKAYQVYFDALESGVDVNIDDASSAISDSVSEIELKDSEIFSSGTSESDSENKEASNTDGGSKNKDTSSDSDSSVELTASETQSSETQSSEIDPGSSSEDESSSFVSHTGLYGRNPKDSGSSDSGSKPESSGKKSDAKSAAEAALEELLKSTPDAKSDAAVAYLKNLDKHIQDLLQNLSKIKDDEEEYDFYKLEFSDFVKTNLKDQASLNKLLDNPTPAQTEKVKKLLRFFNGVAIGANGLGLSGVKDFVEDLRKAFAKIGSSTSGKEENKADPATVDKRELFIQMILFFTKYVGYWLGDEDEVDLVTESFVYQGGLGQILTEAEEEKSLSDSVTSGGGNVIKLTNPQTIATFLSPLKQKPIVLSMLKHFASDPGFNTLVPQASRQKIATNISKSASQSIGQNSALAKMFGTAAEIVKPYFKRMGVIIQTKEKVNLKDIASAPEGEEKKTTSTTSGKAASFSSKETESNSGVDPKDIDQNAFDDYAKTIKVEIANDAYEKLLTGGGKDLVDSVEITSTQKLGGESESNLSPELLNSPFFKSLAKHVVADAVLAYRNMVKYISKNPTLADPSTDDARKQLKGLEMLMGDKTKYAKPQNYFNKSDAGNLALACNALKLNSPAGKNYLSYLNKKLGNSSNGFEIIKNLEAAIDLKFFGILGRLYSDFLVNRDDSNFNYFDMKTDEDPRPEAEAVAEPEVEKEETAPGGESTESKADSAAKPKEAANKRLKKILTTLSSGMLKGMQRFGWSSKTKEVLKRVGKINPQDYLVAYEGAKDKGEKTLDVIKAKLSSPGGPFDKDTKRMFGSYTGGHKQMKNSLADLINLNFELMSDSSKAKDFKAAVNSTASQFGANKESLHNSMEAMKALHDEVSVTKDMLTEGGRKAYEIINEMNTGYSERVKIFCAEVIDLIVDTTRTSSEFNDNRFNIDVSKIIDNLGLDEEIQSGDTVVEEGLVYGTKTKIINPSSFQSLYNTNASLNESLLGLLAYAGIAGAVGVGGAVSAGVIGMKRAYESGAADKKSQEELKELLHDMRESLFDDTGVFYGKDHSTAGISPDVKKSFFNAAIREKYHDDLSEELEEAAVQHYSEPNFLIDMMFPKGFNEKANQERAKLISIYALPLIGVTADMKTKYEGYPFIDQYEYIMRYFTKYPGELPEVKEHALYDPNVDDFMSESNPKLFSAKARIASKEQLTKKAKEFKSANNLVDALAAVRASVDAFNKRHIDPDSRDSHYVRGFRKKTAIYQEDDEIKFTDNERAIRTYGEDFVEPNDIINKIKTLTEKPFSLRKLLSGQAQEVTVLDTGFWRDAYGAILVSLKTMQQFKKEVAKTDLTDVGDDLFKYSRGELLGMEDIRLITIISHKGGNKVRIQRVSVAPGDTKESDGKLKPLQLDIEDFDLNVLVQAKNYTETSIVKTNRDGVTSDPKDDLDFDLESEDLDFDLESEESGTDLPREGITRSGPLGLIINEGFLVNKDVQKKEDSAALSRWRKLAGLE